MPEIAEVARLVHFLRQHLVGKKIGKVQAPDDANIFGKVGCSGPAFEKALTGRKVLEAGSQGKYFWLRLSDPGSHPVMHLGMTGWIHIHNDRSGYTNYYKKTNADDQEAWPPRFWKFQLETEGSSPVRIAFTDSRRFGRIRLVDCPGAEIRQNSPLVENGPDPVVDKEVFTEEYLKSIMRKRHVPVKALILDQAVISGVGNWVADESLYHAKLHPEQYCNEFSDEEIKRLHESIRYVCQTACDLLADSDKFPSHWMFDHRWGKGKGASTLPNGDKLAWITVGGRTSCYVPAVQKKTGHVIPGIKEEAAEDDDTVTKPDNGKGRKGKKQDAEEDEVKPKKGSVRRHPAQKDEEADAKPKKGKSRKSAVQETADEEVEPPRKKAKVKQEVAKEQKAPKAKPAKKTNGADTAVASGRRRSTRLSNGL
ncbi:hypothetical protein N0V82_004806 [Gnomoniopsis sp. IMI 355080]|nr:hypothetical protein N0V82_004806 [Gnomoniopsis sp. IMI 355080]